MACRTPGRLLHDIPDEDREHAGDERVDALLGTLIGQTGILLSLTGTRQSTNKAIAIQAVLQHSFRYAVFLYLFRRAAD